MPRYDNDQCVRCGGIRVAKSTLCIDCLVARVNSFDPVLEIAEVRIKELEGKVKKLTEICERLLDHITREILEPSDIDEQIRKYWGRV